MLAFLASRRSRVLILAALGALIVVPVVIVVMIQLVRGAV